MTQVKKFLNNESEENNMLRNEKIESTFTERELGILENVFSENTPMKDITISNLQSIQCNLNEHIYEEGWINGQGNTPTEYLEEAGIVREKLNALTEDEGDQLYKFLVQRKEVEEIEVAE